MPASQEKLRKRRVWLVLGASFVLAGGFWWLLRAGGLPLLPSREAILRIGVSGVLGYSILWCLTMTLKAYRWRYQVELIAAVPLSRIFSASALGFAAQLFLPLKTGEVARPMLISRGTRVSFFAAMSTSATERIVDALFASLILVGSLLNAEVLDPLPERIGDLPIPAKLVPTLGYVAALGSIAAILLVALFYAFRQPAQRLIGATLGRVSERAGGVLVAKLGDLAEGFSLLANPANALRYVLVTALYWSSYVCGILLLLRASGFSEATVAQAGVLAGTLAFGFAVPNAPGFFGVFQVSIYAALAVFYPIGLVQDLGATTVFWLYVLQLGLVFAVAPIAAWYEHRAGHGASYGL